MDYEFGFSRLGRRTAKRRSPDESFESVVISGGGLRYQAI
jgi:hypothetical protein